MRVKENLCTKCLFNKWYHGHCTLWVDDGCNNYDDYCLNWRAKLVVKSRASHNSSSHKMPLLEEVQQAYCAIPNNEPASPELGAIEFCYDYISRHIEH